MARGTQRRSRVAARVPPPLPGLSPAPDCLQEADGGTEEEAEGGDQSAEGGPRRVRRGVSPTGRGSLRAERGGNEWPCPAGRSGCALEAAPCPTCPARPAPRSPGSPLGCSTRLGAELGGAREEGASGRLRMARETEGPLLFLRWLQEPFGWPRGASEALPAGVGHPLPAPRPCPFPAAALRRVGRRDARVRTVSGQLGLQEEGGCGAVRGTPASIDPDLCPGGWAPSLTPCSSLPAWAGLCPGFSVCSL